MVSVRLIVPADRSSLVIGQLDDDDRVTNVVAVRGGGVRPAGDLVQCEVTREAASDVLGWLRRQGIYDDGSAVLSEVMAAPSRNARATEAAAAGAPDDAIVWDTVLDTAYGEARGSWAFYAFLTLATAIAAVAVVNDSSILVVGAMVVGPEFGVVAALAVGIAATRWGLAGRAMLLLLKGFGVAIVVTMMLALAARAAGWVVLSDVTGPRPLTGFIWRPDQWSAVVAVLAGLRRRPVSDRRPVQRPGRGVHLRHHRARRWRHRAVPRNGRTRPGHRISRATRHQPARDDPRRRPTLVVQRTLWKVTGKRRTTTGPRRGHA